MNKNIISELGRIKSLMGIIVEQSPSADMYIDKVSQGEIKSENMPRYKRIKLGKGTNYELILPGVNTYASSKGMEGESSYDEPNIKTSNVGVTAADFIKDVLVDENGNEYIMRDKTKFCLPDKEFWNIFSNSNVVYQIINGRNNKVFSLVLKNAPDSDIVVKSENGKPTKKSVPGYEAAAACQGGTNGWQWLVDQSNIFFTLEGGKLVSYNWTKPEHMDTRNNFDVWWDKYKTWVEIGIGLVAAVTGAGLAALLLRSGFLAGTIFSASYMGGNTTVLSVLLQATAEAGLMYPIIDYKLDRGLNDEAQMDMIFCFFPFLTELGTVQRFLGAGIQPQTTKSLFEKYVRFTGGGSMDLASYTRFLDELDAAELLLWKATCEQLSTQAGQKEFVDKLAKYLKENAEVINQEIVGNPSLTKKIDGVTGGMYSKTVVPILGFGAKQNPLKGTGFWAVLARTFGTIGGISIALDKIAAKVKEYKYKPEDEEKLVKEIENALVTSTYIQQLSQIDPENFKEVFEKAMMEYVSDKKNTDNIINDVLKDDAIRSEIENHHRKEILSDPAKYQKLVALSVQKSTPNELNEFLEFKILDFLECLLPRQQCVSKHSDAELTLVKNLKTYNFTSNLTKNGQVNIKKNINSYSDVNDLDFSNPKDVEIILNIDEKSNNVTQN